MYVIKNLTDKPLPIDHVVLDPKQQLRATHLTPDIQAARDAGTLQVRSGDTTLAERQADVAAIDSGIKRDI